MLLLRRCMDSESVLPCRNSSAVAALRLLHCGIAFDLGVDLKLITR